MAINLWKLAGKPTSYNPLQVGLLSNQSCVINNGEYIISFRAKSNINAQLTLVSTDDSNVFVNDVVVPSGGYVINLTNDYKEYSLVYNYKKANATLYFRDKNAKGDIIIEDIQLVQKPLPTLTINGIDGFLSGKWNLHPNVKVIDDETLELNATGNYQESNEIINVTQNTIMTLAISEFIDGQRVFVDGVQSGNTIVSSASFNIVSFNTGINDKLKIRFTNSKLGKFTFKKPMLNLGSIPAPYEPKRGERMVLPVAKKNLWEKEKLSYGIDAVSGFGNSGVWNNKDLNIPLNGAIANTISLPIGKYILSFTTQKDSGMKLLIDSNLYLITAVKGKRYSYIIDNFNIALKIGFGVYTSDQLITNIQLEEGTVATPYEPYAVQLNKKPAKPLAQTKRILPSKRVLEAKR
jgi:hypothetical protein